MYGFTSPAAQGTWQCTPCPPPPCSARHSGICVVHIPLIPPSLLPSPPPSSTYTLPAEVHEYLGLHQQLGAACNASLAHHCFVLQSRLSPQSLPGGKGAGDGWWAGGGGGVRRRKRLRGCNAPLAQHCTALHGAQAYAVRAVDCIHHMPAAYLMVAKAIREAFAAAEKGAVERGVGEMIQEEGGETGAGAAANGTSGGGAGVGGSKGRKQPPLILVACRLEADEKGEVEACGFEERLLKPLRKSIVAACLVQVLGIMTTSRSSNTQKQQRRKAMHALIGGRRILVSGHRG
ncbi:unnamed protein product [Closterium sp. NIES-53]